MRRRITLILTALCVGAVALSAQQSALALRVVTDSNGYLRVSVGASTGTSSQAQSLANTRLVTDANNYLKINCDNCITSAAPTFTGSAPSVANVGANSCGTSAATVTGNDTVGFVTVGATSGTQCRVTFTAAATTRRVCLINNETTANLARSTVVSTTATDFFGTFVGGDVISYLCFVR